jgi:hypothetical protein
VTSSTQPIIFIDMDDVLVVSREFTSYQVIIAFKLNQADNWPEPWQGLVLPEARPNLAALYEEFSPKYVVSPSWSKHLGQDQMSEVFRRNGLGFVADNLHEQWDTRKSDVSTRREGAEARVRYFGNRRTYFK